MKSTHATRGFHGPIENFISYRWELSMLFLLGKFRSLRNVSFQVNPKNKRVILNHLIKKKDPLYSPKVFHNPLNYFSIYCTAIPQQLLKQGIGPLTKFVFFYFSFQKFTYKLTLSRQLGNFEDTKCYKPQSVKPQWLHASYSVKT